MSAEPPGAGLQRLADLFGVATSYHDVTGRLCRPDEEALLAILRARGAELDPANRRLDEAIAARERELAGRLVEPVIVDWESEGAPLQLLLPGAAPEVLTFDVLLEDGTQRSFSRSAADLRPTQPGVYSTTLPAGLPLGYHELLTRVAGREAHSILVVAPRRAYQGEDDGGGWAVFAPLYALESKSSWGVGDLSQLEDLIEWTRGLGGRGVATLPLLASYLDAPFDPSPYSPASRLFWNELYLDVVRIPELSKCAAAKALLSESRLVRELADLRALPMVDYTRSMKAKKQVLKELSHCFFSEPAPERMSAFRTYLGEHPQAEDYAAFRAAVERQKTAWTEWPARLRDGDLTPADYDEADGRYHLYCQFLFDEQLNRVSQAGSGLYLDLPLGVNPGGYDTWRERDCFAAGVSGGAPPDPFFTEGQDWGFQPLDPDNLREHQYYYLIACLRSHMSRASHLRIDHVMGLHRLFWVPQGFEAREGAYVYYPAEEIYAILCLESLRNKCVLIGEDLGTVPPEIRPAMREHGIKGMYVLQYEVQPSRPGLLASPPAVPPGSVAALNTHDMPPFASFLEAHDIEQGGALTAALSFLATSEAELLLVNLEDLWREIDGQNTPGTGQELPNWRRKLAYTLEEIKELPEVIETLRLVDQERADAADRIEKAKDSSPDNAVREWSLLSDEDIYLFNEGSHLRLYEHLGSRVLTCDGESGTHFSVWAPNAQSVSVIGDFNGWDPRRHPLRPRQSSGIWEGFIAGVGQGAVYKYHVVSRHAGYRVDKADPFGLRHETPPKTGSVVWDLEYSWQDSEWMSKRSERNGTRAATAVYEVHLGSWARVSEEDCRSLTYREIAPRLADHVVDMGFTHVELLPIMEHPFFGSWGYQTTGYFAPTSRYGSPQDLMFFIDHMHQRGIGVILDWVPSHFPGDEHGLAYFDGTHLFEHSDPRQGFHPDWQSYIFNYGRHEVRSFLLSSAMFWLDKYHIDGLRVDAVASMLYLDYSRQPDEWIPNTFGGRENLEAIEFLQRLNLEVYAHYPDVQTVAEESTSWPMVSRPTYLGGLGFGLKWDMGWMHDTLHYMAHDPVHRRFHHEELTFRMIYAFTENFLLPLSHDEVVHGKGSLLGQMPGDDWQKFANLRLLFTYMYASSGKKLLFMGGELAQWREWGHDRSLDWHLLEHAPHAGMQRLVRQLNELYRGEPALHELDLEPEGFEWVAANDSEQSVISFLRRGGSTDDVLLFAFNFTPVPRHNYLIGVPRSGMWQELFNSDASEYGGSGQGNLGGIEARPITCHGRPYCLALTLPPLAGVALINRA